MRYGFKNMFAISASKIPARGNGAALVTFKGLGLHFNCGVKMSVQELSSLFQAQKQLLGESREVDL